MIKIENGTVRSDAGKMVQRISNGDCGRGMSMLLGETAESFREVDEASRPAYTEEERKAKVVELIRRRYSDTQEMAVLHETINVLLTPTRSRTDEDTAALERFSEYDAYVAKCKEDAPVLLTSSAVTETAEITEHSEHSDNAEESAE